ncbi:hypothetical protein BFW38_09690 [Terasakiispira papahanaumokuakeensis]|uniref:Anti sigma-E protein RseA N-terminal domain-containing protein n=1 Tax=Terasakiispira papahanaumokuakeensis TaxID=197479 RepID=A0A1E2V9V9_9GAMM|nr:sigma-E factor negative regulatory protein [Terasakiispira papahanaumokuakeensis]ODC03771.1 hypothetical protein BFW38_09690 [Terasakiispira papahanaumokuakeensis]
MSEQVRQSLSSLMDDEADDLDLPRLMRAVEASPEVAQTWRRYHLAQAVLRRETSSIDWGCDISAGVMAALEDEDTYGQSAALSEAAKRSAARHPEWRQWMRSGALAASVAVAVVSGVQLYNAFPGEENVGDGVAAVVPSTAGRRTADIQPVSESIAVPSPAMSLSSRYSSPVAAYPAAVSSGNILRVSQPAQTPMQPLVNQGLLNPYLLHHAEMSAVGTRQGLLPLLRVSSLHQTSALER